MDSLRQRLSFEHQQLQGLKDFLDPLLDFPGIDEQPGNYLDTLELYLKERQMEIQPLRSFSGIPKLVK